ncbi:MAG: hypothetical protein ACOYL8_02605 [Patescibacteria group bacterium]
MKIKNLKILLFLALILIPIGSARAMDAKTGDSIYVSKDEIVSGNLYAAGNTVTVEGVISGDLITVAQTINVNGRIEGDIIAIAQNITINGEIGGNIRVAGSIININGSVARNVNSFGSEIVFGKDSKVGWDVYAAGLNLEARGNIEGGLSGQVEQALISGRIVKDTNLSISNDINKPVTITETAQLGGKFNQKFTKSTEINWLALWAWAKVYAIFCSLIVGLVLIYLGKNTTKEILKKIEDESNKTLWPGALGLFAAPLLILFLFFTIIGIPLALIVIALWLILIYIAKIFVSLSLGQIILKKIIKKTEFNLIWPLILGTIICYLLFSIPFVGWIISLLATFIGLGGIYLYASNKLRNL